MKSDLTTKEERLSYWDKLLKGDPLGPQDIEDLFSCCLPLAKESSHQERVSTVLLFAAAELSRSGTESTKTDLNAVLRYWFSKQGEKIRPKSFDPKELDDPGIDGVVGLGLTWGEAMESVGKSPDNLMALSRIKKQLKEKANNKWEELFDSSPPRAFGSDNGTDS
ncbi:hypothetical protein KGY77_11175 [Candidatus Bipolaricaulota bacterium]|nr:hypothetical protein [Candidatus Bipolaricaulota bacterium]